MATKSKANPAKGGRPSSYRPEFAKLAASFAKLGATDRDVANELGVSEATLHRWKHSHPELCDALKVGKEAADARVIQSLYRRATGYSYDAVKILQAGGKPLIVPYVEHVPPDTTACIFWLKNRDKANWRDKVDTELTGKDGGPVEMVSFDVSKLSRETLQELMRARRGETESG